MVTAIISVVLDHERLPIFLFGFICIFQIAYKEPKLFLEIEKANAIFNMFITENLENIKFYIEESKVTILPVRIITKMCYISLILLHKCVYNLCPSPPPAD